LESWIQERQQLNPHGSFRARNVVVAALVSGAKSPVSCRLQRESLAESKIVVDRDAKADFGKKMEQNRDRLCPCASRVKFSFYGHGWLQPRRSSQPRAFIWNRLRPWSSSNLGRALRFRQSFQPS